MAQDGPEFGVMDDDWGGARMPLFSKQVEVVPAWLFHCPACHVDVTLREPTKRVECPHCERTFEVVSESGNE